MENLLPGVPLVESPFVNLAFGAPDTAPETRRIAFDLANQGYAILDFPDAALAARAAAIKANLSPHYDMATWRSSGHRTGGDLRVLNAWRFDENVRALACNQAIIDLLGALYGRAALPFQTLNFPVGTQQHAHTDSVHFSSNPERFMCAVWIALEDTDADNGPLMFYPGSHRWPIYTNEHIRRCVTHMKDAPTQALYEEMWQQLVEVSGIEPVYFHAKRGQALIWAANLIHGGAPQRDVARTRWSQVTHYFFEDCAYYTPMGSDTYYGNIAFRHPVNIMSGKPIPQRYAGWPVPASVINRERVDGSETALEFDAELYLAANPDVKAAGLNPAEHYLKYGRKEKRRLQP